MKKKLISVLLVLSLILMNTVTVLAEEPCEENTAVCIDENNYEDANVTCKSEVGKYEAAFTP